MSQIIKVGISDLNIAKNGDVLVTYALGSCVGICLYDARLRIAGLSHIMLPSSEGFNALGKQEEKFADTAIKRLLQLMAREGALQSRLTAKIAGGAQMFPGVSNSSLSNIGLRNVTAVKAELIKHRIPIVAEDTGKDYGRTQYFYSEDGKMIIKSAIKGEWHY